MRNANIQEETVADGTGGDGASEHHQPSMPEALSTGTAGNGSQGDEENRNKSKMADDALAISTACLAQVQQFRRGLCSKVAAIASITEILVESTFDSTQVGAALRNFRLILDKPRTVDLDEEETPIDASVGSLRAKRGRQTAGAQSETGSVNGRRRVESGASKAPTHVPEESSASSDDDQDIALNTTVLPTSSDESAAKRQRLGYHRRKKEAIEEFSSEEDTEYPWESFRGCLVPLSVEQRRTKELLDKWNSSDRAFKRAYSKLIRAPGVPRVPRSQLKLMLAGDFVDLDKLYASVNSLVAETNLRAKIGDSISLELEGEVTSTKLVNARVTDQASYTVASHLLHSAMLFLFGDYRQDELTAYFSHIQTMFSSLSPAHHICVINYDKAVRLFIAQSNDVAFNELTKFSHLERANLHPLGVNVSVDQSITRAAKDRLSVGLSNNRRRNHRPVEICRNFNAGRCLKSSQDCPYRHLCSNCHKSGHSAKDSKCTEDSSKSPASA